MGKKPIVSVTYENEKISIKKTAYLTQNVCHVSPVWSVGRETAINPLIPFLAAGLFTIVNTVSYFISHANP